MEYLQNTNITISLTTRRFKRFVTFTFRNDYVLKVKGLESVNVGSTYVFFQYLQIVLCYVLLQSVWRIRNVDLGSRILNLTHFGSPIQNTSKRQLWEENGF